MTLLQVRDVFAPILPNAVFHYIADFESDDQEADISPPDKYIVWAEDGQANASYSDNKMNQQATEGTVDLYTKEEYDPIFITIQSAMNSSDMTWRWNSTQFERDTGYIHHEWVWQAVNNVG